jgi:hypothetical protein
MAEGKIRISALEGTPELIADFKRAARMDWSSPPPGAVKNLIPLENAKDIYLKEAQELAKGDARTEIAVGIWHRFAPENRISWEEEMQKSEYLMAVDGITTGQLFNELVRRLNYDGNDTASITLGEIQRAVVGAKL